MGYQGQNSRDFVRRRYGPPLSMVSISAAQLLDALPACTDLLGRLIT